MSQDSTSALTRALHAAESGRPSAAAELLPLVYAELRELARARLAAAPGGQTLQATALVHEVYMRLVGPQGNAANLQQWNGSSHFFGAAAKAMRNILVDRARQKYSLKGGQSRRVDAAGFLDSAQTQAGEPPADELLALDDALNRLEASDSRKAQIVMLKYFAGLTHEQIATALDVSIPTVEREWRFSRAWLQQFISERLAATDRSDS